MSKIAKKDSTVVIKREKINSLQNLKLKLNRENMCASRNDQQQPTVATTSDEDRHSSGESLIEQDFNELDLDAELQALDYDTTNSGMNDTRIDHNRKMYTFSKKSLLFLP